MEIRDSERGCVKMYVNMLFDALSSFYEKKARTFTSSGLCCFLKFS